MTTKKEPVAKKPAAPKKVAASKKAAAPKAAAPKKEHAAPAPTGSYFSAVGRRKSGIANVWLYTSGSGKFTVNGKDIKEYLPVEQLHDDAILPLKAVGMDQTADVVVKAEGGGIRGQADAIKLGIARALLKINPDYRATLKPLGVLTRDPREKERKKYGLKKARKSPQWAKR